MEILVSAFKGTNNASNKVLNEITYKCDKLYFSNDKNLSEQQLFTTLENIQYDYIIMLGQKPIIKDKISIETTAKAQIEVIKTDFDYTNAVDFFNDNGFTAYLSNNAGTSYCNHIYYTCLKYIENAKQSKAIFIHIPYLKNIKNISSLVTTLDAYINSLSTCTINK